MVVVGPGPGLREALGEAVVEDSLGEAGEQVYPPLWSNSLLTQQISHACRSSKAQSKTEKLIVFVRGPACGSESGWPQIFFRNSSTAQVRHAHQLAQE